MEDGDLKDGSKPTLGSPTASIYPISKAQNERTFDNLGRDQQMENCEGLNHCKNKKCQLPFKDDGFEGEEEEFDSIVRTKTLVKGSCEPCLNGTFDLHDSISDCNTFNEASNPEDYLLKQFNETLNITTECSATLHPTMPTTRPKVSNSAPGLNGCTYASCGQLPNVCLCSFRNTGSVTDSNHSPKCASNHCNTKATSPFQFKFTEGPKTNGFNCELVQESELHSAQANFWCESFKSQSSCCSSTVSLPSENVSECKMSIPQSLGPEETMSCIVYVGYESEKQMPDIMRLIQKDLSEPYSVYTYRYFIHNWPHLCFLAFHDDKCVGAVVCKLDMHKKSIRRGYIAMLAIDENYRKKRIGSNLVLKAIKAMIMDDADEVVLETEITNKPALQLYENLGFVRDKRLFRYYLNGVDALRLKLWLK